MPKLLTSIVCLIACMSGPVLLALQDESVEEAQHAERFLDLLKRRPSFGTALERVAIFHVEQGTLDDLIARLCSVPTSDPDSEVQRLIGGMLEVHRGNGAEAVELLKEVEVRRENDPVASQALGLAARAAGDISGAVAALERALSRHPAKPDLHAIYRDLARLHHQSGHPDRALEVWQNLESEFPDDLVIREDVASRLQQDGQLEPALERWEKLAASSTNPERRTQYRLSESEIRLRLGQHPQALQVLEEELGRIRPGGWLDELIRTRIESVLLGTDGLQAVIQYYRDRIDGHPQDTSSIMRLASLLAEQGEFAQAVALYRTAIALMPSLIPPRAALIDLLANQRKVSEAVAAGRELVELSDAGTDEYELVGRLILRDPDVESSQRERQASEMWMRICEDRSDPVKLGYTARLHRRFGLSQKAIELFQETVQLEPANAIWRQELGETLYEAGRREEALSVWHAIADGDRTNTRNLTLRSEILERAGEFELSVQSMREACELDPVISDRIRLADLLRRSGQLEQCYGQLNLASDKAQSTADRRLVNDARIETWKLDPALHQQISRLQKQLNQEDGHSDGWLQLALMNQAIRRTSDAVRCVERATREDPSSVLAWQAATEIFAEAGLLDSAATANRQLAEVSVPLRNKALQQVVQLEQQLGRSEQALEAAERLVVDSPGDGGSCRQYISLCLASGRDIEGLECLRRCLKLNSDDAELCVEFVEILISQFQFEEAATWLWHSFNTVEDSAKRVQLIEALVKLAQQTETVDRVIERLTVSSGLDPVERGLYVATAQQMAGNLSGARETLDRASTQFGRDLRILRMQVDLAEAANELEVAALYQRQVASISAVTEEQLRLANLQHKTGELSESELSWIRDARSGTDTIAAIRSIDRFLDAGRVEAAELMCQRLVGDRPRDWRILYRLALIQWRLDRKQAAAVTLQKIIDLDLPSDHSFPESQSEEDTFSESVDVSVGQGITARSRRRVVTRLRAVSPLARRATHVLDALTWLELYTDTEMWSQRLHAPEDYGAAHCAAYGLLWLQHNAADRKAMVEPLVDFTTVTSRRIATWCTLVVTARGTSARQDLKENKLVALLQQSGRLDHQLAMIGLHCRGGVFMSPGVKRVSRVDSKIDVQKVLDSAELISREHPEWLRDVGGWQAVYRLLSKDRDVSWSDVVARLCDSSNPATVDAATDLAFVTYNADSITRCFRRLLELRAAPAARQVLDARWKRLIAWAQMAKNRIDWDAVNQAIQLLLEIQAARYELVADADAGQATYRLAEGSSPQATVRSVRRLQVNFRRRGSGTEALKVFAPAHDHLAPDFVSLLLELTHGRQFQQHAHEVLADLRDVARNQIVTPDLEHPVWIPASFALAQLYVLEEKPDQGMLALLPVVRRLPLDVGLRLVLARHLTTIGADREALQVLNQLPPQRNRNRILSTEQLALELCVTLQDQERAQLAASRLFELQLEPGDLAIAASRLSAIGLADSAQRFTDRTERDPGGRPSSLRRLMQSYHDAGNTTAAARIARQVILKPSIAVDGDSVETSVELRREALRILVEADAVRPLIRQIQLSLQNDVASFHKRHLLIELLRLDGQTSEADEVAEPLRESLTSDPRSGIELVRQFERQGRLQTACDVCWFLLEADTKLFHRDYYRFIRLFERNGRLAELADMILATNLQQDSSGHWGVQQLSERLLPHDEVRGLRLFRAAWKAWPTGRAALLANVSHDAIWALPEVFEYRQEQVMPADGKTVVEWFGIAERLQVEGFGQVSGTLSHMLRRPQETGQVAELLVRVERGLASQADWYAGQIYTVLLRAVQGDVAASEEMRELLDEHLDRMPPMVVWVTACEMNRVDRRELRPAVVRMLNHLHTLSESGTVLMKSSASWHASPDYLLLQLHVAQQDSTSARVVIDRLIQRIGRGTQAQFSTAVDYGDALNVLAASINEQFPEEAARIRKRAVGRPQPTVEQQSVTHSRTPQSEKLIQAVRERLLNAEP